MKKKFVLDLTNLMLETLCLMSMILYTFGVVITGVFPGWLKISLLISVIVWNVLYVLSKRGGKVFLKNSLYQLPIAVVLYFVLHHDLLAVICIYTWLFYVGTKILTIRMEAVLSELNVDMENDSDG